jgi:hypothetical protein
LYSWQSSEFNPIRASLDKNRQAEDQFRKRVNLTIAAFAEQGKISFKFPLILS